MAPFITCNKTDDAPHVAKLVFHKIFRLHGLPISIVFGRDVKFMSYFLIILWKLYGTTLKFYIACHPQIEGQTKVVNRTLGDILRCVIGRNRVHGT